MTATGRGSLSSFVGTLVGIAWYGALILLALSVCLLVVAPWVDPPRVEVGFAVPAAFQLEPDAHQLTASPSDVAHVYLDRANGELKFSPRNRGAVAASAVTLIVLFALALWVLGQLRALFRTLNAGRPFVTDNATRIRRIAYAVMGGEIVRSAMAFAGMRYAMTNFAFAGVRFQLRPDIHVVTLVCGLIILVIAEVFREGTRLDEEQSLTV